MKKLGFVVIVLLVVVAGVWAFNAHSQQADKTTGAVREISGVQKMPDSYTEKASYKGKLVELSYKMHMADGSGRTVAKKAMVYLPYNYSEGTKYDVFYLMHGYGGTYETFLGSKVSPRTFKRVLDNMIANGKIKPLIVVTPEYTEEYADYYSIIEGEGTEIVKDLMPLIESKYSTYAASTSSKGQVQSSSCCGWIFHGRLRYLVYAEKLFEILPVLYAYEHAYVLQRRRLRGGLQRCLRQRDLRRRVRDIKKEYENRYFCRVRRV